MIVIGLMVSNHYFCYRFWTESVFHVTLWRCRVHPKTFPVFGQRQLPASVARSHAVLALARGYSLIDRIAPDDTARLRVGV